MRHIIQTWAIVFVIIFASQALSQEDQKTKRPAIQLVGRALMESGFDEAIRVFKDLLAERNDFIWEESYFTGLAKSMIYDGKPTQAIEFLKLTGEIFENSIEVHLSLGEAFIVTGDKNNADKSFKKALQINPQNAVAQKYLRSLDRRIILLKDHTLLEMKYSFDKDSELSGKYLGQPPPRLVPKVFAPGIISTEIRESISMITKDGKEIWYSVSISHTRAPMMVVREKNGQWCDPEEITFSDVTNILYPSLSPDGKRIYFSSNGRDQNSNPTNTQDIWFVEKIDSDWSEPELLGQPVNTEFNDLHPFISSEGNLYFISDRPGGLGGRDIYYSKSVDGKFCEPINLTAVNSNQWEWDVTVSPDENYLILSSNLESSDPDTMDLFVSFKNKNGSWSKPVKMGSDINTPLTEAGAVFSPDGKYLFYHSSRIHPNSDELGYGNGLADIYWVRKEALEQYRPKQFRKKYKSADIYSF